MSDLQAIGQVADVSFPKLGLKHVPARVDTGATTSAVWASGIIEKQGLLQCVLFGPDSPYYTGEVLRFSDYHQRAVVSSIGQREERYVVKFPVIIAGRKVRASFTLANRSRQTYPVLIGRNLLRGKFVVNVKQRKGEQ